MKNITHINLPLICLIFLLANFVLNSQPKELNYSNWFLGSKVGLTFNTPDSIPKEIFSNLDTLYANEGISTYSDNQGNVKLVCNGKRLVHFYDSNDLDKYKIFEFKDILRFTSSTNSTIILPSLSNPNQYFVFIVGETFDGKFYNEMYYGIFDVSINNGEGDFTQDLKQINDETSEKLAVIYDYKHNWYWIATTTFSNPSPGNTRFLFYKLDESGFNENPKEIDSGARYHLIGDMIFSKSGKYLAVCGLGSFNFGIYKFDFENCELEKILKYYDPFAGIYGAEFSDDESKFYITYNKEENNEQLGYLEQFTISDKEAEMLNSKSTIIKDSLYFGNIKRGLDNRLYIANMEYYSAFSTTNHSNTYNYFTVLDNANMNKDDISLSTLKFSNGRYSYLGQQTTPVILNEKKRQYIIDQPEYACFGDEYIVAIKSNYAENFTAEIEKIYPAENYSRSFSSIDSVLTFYDTNNNNKQYQSAFQVRITTESLKYDTIQFNMKYFSCCNNTVRNPQFNMRASNGSWGTCYTVDYETDMDFRKSSNGPCPNEFDAFGQLASTNRAEFHNPNFYKQAKVNANMLIGDPLPNTPQRAWYQENPTRKGTRYKFSAYVCNVERISRIQSDKRKLNIWLGIKNRNQDLQLKKLEDIKYEDDWIKLSDEFIAEDNSTELAIWVEGLSHDSDEPSYGFAIDDIELIPLPDYSLDAEKDTIICISESVLLDNKFEGDITTIEWIPTTGLDDPTSLTPIASPTESTTYSLKISDKYFCEFQEDIVIEVDPCLPICTPDLSVYLSDKTVQLGDTFCINGTYIPECAEDTFLDKLNIYFEYDPFLMSFLSTTSSTYSIIQNNDKNILILTFENDDFILNQANEFSFCFRSLLGDSKYPVINVLDNNESKISYSLIDSINSNIEYISCDQPLRQIKMITITDFEAVLVNRSLSIKLATEEEGFFKFIIVDVNGQIVKQEDYISNKNKYTYEEIFQIDLSDIASGVYNIRMTSPSGKFYIKKIILLE